MVVDRRGRCSSWVRGGRSAAARVRGGGMTATEQYIETDHATPRAAARARWAVTAVFFLNGLTMSSYIVRLPSLKVANHLTDAQLGVLATVFGAAALVAMQFVGGLVARYGTRPVIRLG